MRLIGRVLVACTALLACACTGGGTTVGSALTLPTGDSSALATTTLYTSPDGGIYRNPDRVEVRMVMRGSTSGLATLLPTLTALRELAPLGEFTFVGVAVHNDGKAFSDPQLNAMQIASDFAPDGTATGALRHYYHPLFPLAVLTTRGSDASCTLHVDPGQTAVAVLLYPPLRPASSIVWGVYHDFALRVAFGGALPSGTYAWRAQPCEPPQPPPAT